MLREIGKIDGFSDFLPSSPGTPFIPPKEQMGLLGDEFLPPPQTFKTSGVTLELPMDVEAGRRRIKTSHRTLSLGQVNAIVQARDEYEGVEELAGAIDEAGFVIHDPLIGQFDEDGASRYLSFVYGIYGDKVPEKKRISDLVPSIHEGEETYYIVIAGHRRLRALEINSEQNVDVKIVKGIDALHALVLQAQENTPKLLKDYERAEQHGRLWAVSKIASPELTHEQFAKRMGFKAKVIVRDLRYYKLPDPVKNYVVPRRREDTGAGNTFIPDQPLMPFNVACQLGRLVEAGAPEHDVLFLARRFFEEGITSERAAGERVSAYLRENKSDTQDMADIFGVNLARLARGRRVKQVAGRYASAIDNATIFFNRVRQSQEMGLSDRVEDGVSFAAAATRLKNFAGIIEAILPGMRDLIEDEAEIERVRNVFTEMQDLAEGIEEKIGANGNFRPESEETPLV